LGRTHTWSSVAAEYAPEVVGRTHGNSVLDVTGVAVHEALEVAVAVVFSAHHISDILLREIFVASGDRLRGCRGIAPELVGEIKVSRGGDVGGAVLPVIETGTIGYS
jgi:hypothetical protein